LLDRLGGQYRGVVSVAVIVRDRRLAKGLLVLLDEIGIGLAHRFRREVGIGDQEADSGRASCFYEIGGKEGSAAEERGVLEPRCLLRLAQDLRARRRKDGKIDEVRFFAADARQQRVH
jgi:hypothetical protein